jgi:hypothetical protein
MGDEYQIGGILGNPPFDDEGDEPMAGDDALSDEQVHNFVEQLEVCRSLDDDKRVVLAAARLAQQREREAWVGALQTWLASRDVKVAICGGEQVAADLPSLLDDVFALLDAAALARPDAVEDGARRFAGLVLEYSRDNDFVDVDAGSIQDWALDCGLLEGVRVTEACGECCACAESDDFPQTCIRYSEAGIRVRSAARKGAEENGR